MARHRLPVQLLYAWLSNIVALFAAAWIIPGIGYGDDWWTLVLAALVFALVNAVVRPLVVVLALPAVVLSLGIGLFFVSMLMLWITDEIVPSFEAGGFWSLVGGTLIVWLVNTLLSGLQHRERHERPDADARV